MTDMTVTESPALGVSVEQINSSTRPAIVSAIVSALLVLIACLRIASTYSVFNHTYDEAAHIACGLEWWTSGKYTYEAQHTPLSRIAAAAGPYRLGLRTNRPDRDFWTEGNRILYHDNYEHTLGLARLGILPFFVLSCIVVWLWTRRLYGPFSAAAAVALYSMLPSVLAHAGLATTDMAATAGLAFAAYAIDRWLKHPLPRNSAFAGVAIAIAIGSKLSNVLFLGVSILVIALVHRRQLKTIGFRQPMIAALMVFFSLWGIYRFAVTPLTGPQDRPHRFVEKLVGTTGALADIGNTLIEMPAPLAEVAQGLMMVKAHATAGHSSYFLGQHSTTGNWLFFPVVLLVKTPPAFIVLVLVGAVTVWRQRRSRRNAVTPLLIASAVVAVCILSTINLGIRHILPVFPALAIVAAAGVTAMAAAGKQAGRLAAAALILSCAVSSVSAHPDYLAYFNAFAGSHPENILVDSDLDWGQDLIRLAKWSRENNIPELTLGYYGSALPANHGLPPLRELKPYQSTSGWVAVSMSTLKLRGLELRRPNTPEGAYDWLTAYTPKAYIGKSIRVYHIPEQP